MAAEFVASCLQIGDSPVASPPKQRIGTELAVVPNMPNTALGSVRSALLCKVVPIVVIAGIAGLLLRELLQRLERNASRIFQSYRSARRRPAPTSSAINCQTEHIPDCPMCDVPMVKRSVRRGPRAGQQFWGCSNFPMCRTTRPLNASLTTAQQRSGFAKLTR